MSGAAPDRGIAERALSSADGTHVVLHDTGGDGPPLLLTHGNGLNAGMWYPVLGVLRQRFRCLALDFRGHGRSRPADPQFPVGREHFVDDVLAAVHEVHALCGSDAPLRAAGHSMGGAMLLRAELRSPGTFCGLWTFEPVMRPQSEDGGPHVGVEARISAARRRRMAFDSVDAIVARLGSKPPYDRCRPEALASYAEVGTVPLAEGGVQLSCLGETEARIYEAAYVDDLDRLAAVTCPVVVAAGQLTPDDLPSLVAPRIVAALGARGRLEPHPELTHMAPMEDPERIAASILAALDG